MLILGAFIFAIGASVGSFLNVVADRVPSGGSLVSPRSHCPSCHRQLSRSEMIPVLSYLWLRGRCQTCGSAIPARVVVVEAVTGAVLAALYFRYGIGPEFLALGSAISLLLVVAVIDWEHKLILNKIVLPSLVVALLLAPFWEELGIPRTFFGGDDLVASFLNSFASGLGAFLFFLVIFMMYPQGIGGGDVKLAGLLGLLLGFPGVLVALWGSIVAGGLVAIVLLALRIRSRKDAIPFGTFMAVAAIVVLLAGDDVTSGYTSLMEAIAGL